MLVRRIFRDRRSNAITVAAALAALVAVAAVVPAQEPAALIPAAMLPMDQIGPQPRIGPYPTASRGTWARDPQVLDLRAYAHVVRVAPGGEHRTVGGALASISDASPKKRYAVLVAAGTYKESRLEMKPFVDLYGGFAADDWKDRNVYEHAAVLDAQKNGPVVIGSDAARLDGFVITGGRQKGHGGGIVCDGVSPTIVNNIITGNQTLKRELAEGLGKQVAYEGAGIALLNGSRAYVSNNLICDNSTEIGNGGGITARGNVEAKILRNVFCNNTVGVKDDEVYNQKVGSRSSTGGAIAVSDESSPQISFNVIVLCAAVLNNDGGGIWVEGNSRPPINHNWIVGNYSGDDGGGVYVMGNLYYDEAGKRHDFAPDGPVSIDDNVIVGNDTGRGGPGGVRVSRFGRVELRRNLIVGNEKGGANGAEGGVISLYENNRIADNGALRERRGPGGRWEPAVPTFRLAGDITARKFDGRRHVTELTIGQELGEEDLSGSVVRIGGQWSVVKSSGPGRLVVWGRITGEPLRDNDPFFQGSVSQQATDETPRFEILDHYLATN